LRTAAETPAPQKTGTTVMDESSPATPPNQPFRSRWRRRLAILGILLLAVWVFRASLLRGLAAGLIVDDRPPALQHGALQHGDLPPEPADAVLILGGDRQFDLAADLYHPGATTVLIYRSRPDRMVRMGIMPPAHEIARRELLKRGISSQDLDELAGASLSRSTIGVALGGWLAEHPERKVHVLCDRFTSRTWKVAFRRDVDPSLARQIFIEPLPDRQFDETNWWRSKVGTMAVVNGYIRLGFHYGRPGKEADRVERTTAEFRAAFAGGAGG
jgi:hypothetical protein